MPGRIRSQTAMHLSLQLRRQIARLALCAIAFAALAPAITHWLSASGTALAWAEICGATGLQRVALADPGHAGSTPDSDSATNGHEQCPFCRLQHDLPLLPATTAGQVAGLAPRGTAPPALVAPALPSGSSWTHAPPRAPPALA